MIQPARITDLNLAWLYAANASLHEETPGPAQLNIGSAVEPRMVSRTEAFRDLYAHLLLVDIQADQARLDRLQTQIADASKHSPSPNVEMLWAIAEELCERARAIIVGAGAVDDTNARRRLLAGTKHLNRSVILGQFVPALQEQIDNDLLEELDVIDTD
ncbi:Uncharacterised protein [Mycobacteroides abscessus subsp. massiliense]|uniref:hypothetical protein n=1 Tax=Mycobacteroides abscessus TaxID=36809 RepID=UPI0009A72355|nr:hypothetical protein [Mycobacteroides abscessus]SKK91884.1 Uncharacterised protein [Mycobacteroides abscessus subsp. massiliense]